MAQQLLDRDKVCTVLQQQCRRGMPERMKRHAGLVDAAGIQYSLPDDQPTRRGDALAPHRREQEVVSSLGTELQPVDHSRDGLIHEREHT